MMFLCIFFFKNYFVVYFVWLLMEFLKEKIVSFSFLCILFSILFGIPKTTNIQSFVTFEVWRFGCCCCCYFRFRCALSFLCKFICFLQERNSAKGGASQQINKQRRYLAQLVTSFLRRERRIESTNSLTNSVLIHVGK